MNILFVRMKKKENSRKEAPVYVRITINGEREEWSTGVFCTAADWNLRTHRLRQGDEISEAKNQTLLQTESRLRVIKNELERTEADYSVGLIRKMATRKADPTEPVISLTNLIARFKKHKHDLIGKPGGIVADTYRSYNGRLKQVAAFITGKDLPISEIDRQFGQKFLFWLKGRGLSNTYMYKTFTLLTEVLNYAVMEKLVPSNQLQSVKIKCEKPDNRIHLTLDMLNKIRDYKFAADKLNRVRDLFLMQCYSGVSYSDLPQITRDACYSELGQRWLCFYRNKTKIKAIVLLTQDAETILLKYNYSLPIISNQKYNSYLKEIAGVLGIPIKLVTNSGRKTFGQLHINNGVPLETVARMMGHKNSRTTQEYYTKISEERIKRDLLGAENQYMTINAEVVL